MGWGELFHWEEVERVGAAMGCGGAAERQWLAASREVVGRPSAKARGQASNQCQGHSKSFWISTKDHSLAPDWIWLFISKSLVIEQWTDVYIRKTIWYVSFNFSGCRPDFNLRGGKTSPMEWAGIHYKQKHNRLLQISPMHYRPIREAPRKNSGRVTNISGCCRIYTSPG